MLTYKLIFQTAIFVYVKYTLSKICVECHKKFFSWYVIIDERFS